MSKCELSLEVLQIASISQITHKYENWEVMDCKSFPVVRSLGPSCLLLVLEVCNPKRLYRKSWAANLLMSQTSPWAPATGSNKGSQTYKCFQLVSSEKCCLSSKLVSWPLSVDTSSIWPGCVLSLVLSICLSVFCSFFCPSIYQSTFSFLDSNWKTVCPIKFILDRDIYHHHS